LKRKSQKGQLTRMLVLGLNNICAPFTFKNIIIFLLWKQTRRRPTWSWWSLWPCWWPLDHVMENQLEI